MRLPLGALLTPYVPVHRACVDSQAGHHLPHLNGTCAVVTDLSWSTGMIVWYAQLLVVAAINLVLWARLGLWLYYRGGAEPPPPPEEKPPPPAIAKLPAGCQRSLRLTWHQWRTEGLSFLWPQPEPSLRRYRWKQWALSGVYILVCAQRSITPRVTLCRITLVNTSLGCAGVGRGVATVGELCFAAQWALLVHLLASRLHVRRAVWCARPTSSCLFPSVKYLTSSRRCAWAIWPIIFVAECFSWTSTITANFLWGAVEESLWAVASIVCNRAAHGALRHRAHTPRLGELLTPCIMCGTGVQAGHGALLPGGGRRPQPAVQDRPRAVRRRVLHGVHIYRRAQHPALPIAAPCTWW